MSKNLTSLQNSLRNQISKDIFLREWHSSIILEGTVPSWDEVVKAGKICTGKGYKGVVNRIAVPNLLIPKMKKPKLMDYALQDKKVDVLIIGAGIIGTSIARELSKWNISILIVDKECDVAMQASSRNDGMIHPGIEPKPGSKRAKFNVRGNFLYSKISKELDVKVLRCGSTILYNNKWLSLAKPIVMSRAKKVGVPEVSLLNKEEALKLEPNIGVPFVGALHFGTTGVTSPYKMTVAYAENAIMNGAEISLNTAVLSIHKENEQIISVDTNRGTIYPKVVINAAGIFADKIANMAGDQFFSLHPRKGEIIFLDKKKGNLINGVIAQPSLTLAKGNTKGGGVVKTVDGNVLIGPDAYEEPFREDFSTNMDHINALMKKHLPIINGFSPSDVITYCAGVRAATYEEDFIIEASGYVSNLVYAAGIQSPGFASAPAIAEEIEKITCSILRNCMELKMKQKWNPNRISIPNLNNMSFDERNNLIKSNPSYGEIVCRCECISKGEIIDAIKSPIPIYTVDGIKRRVRAGMGRCQGGFCLPNVMNILKEETGLDMLSLTKKGGDSNILISESKNPVDYEVKS